MNMYSASRSAFRQTINKYRLYNEKKDEDYYNQKFEEIKVNSDEDLLKEIKYKRQRDILMKELNEGKLHDKD